MSCWFDTLFTFVDISVQSMRSMPHFARDTCTVQRDIRDWSHFSEGNAALNCSFKDVGLLLCGRELVLDVLWEEILSVLLVAMCNLPKLQFLRLTVLNVWKILFWLWPMLVVFLVDVREQNMRRREVASSLGTALAKASGGGGAGMARVVFHNCKRKRNAEKSPKNVKLFKTFEKQILSSLSIHHLENCSVLYQFTSTFEDWTSTYAAAIMDNGHSREIENSDEINSANNIIYYIINKKRRFSQYLFLIYYSIPTRCKSTRSRVQHQLQAQNQTIEEYVCKPSPKSKLSALWSSLSSV